MAFEIIIIVQIYITDHSVFKQLLPESYEIPHKKLEFPLVTSYF